MSVFLLFVVVFFSLLVYLVVVELRNRRKARKQAGWKEPARHGRVVAWMLLGWFLGAVLSILNEPFKAGLREYRLVSWVIHGAILGAVIGIVLDVIREHEAHQLQQLTHSPRPFWRYSLRSLLLFIAVVGMICVCVRLYVAIFFQR